MPRESRSVVKSTIQPLPRTKDFACLLIKGPKEAIYMALLSMLWEDNQFIGKSCLPFYATVFGPLDSISTNWETSRLICAFRATSHIPSCQQCLSSAAHRVWNRRDVFDPEQCGHSVWRGNLLHNVRLPTFRLILSLIVLQMLEQHKTCKAANNRLPSSYNRLVETRELWRTFSMLSSCQQ